MEPRPILTEFLDTDPYEDESNPPLNPDEISGFCGLQWQPEIDETTGNRKYKLADFETEAEALQVGLSLINRLIG